MFSRDENKMVKRLLRRFEIEVALVTDGGNQYAGAKYMVALGQLLRAGIDRIVIAKQQFSLTEALRPLADLDDCQQCAVLAAIRSAKTPFLEEWREGFELIDPELLFICPSQIVLLFEELDEKEILNAVLSQTAPEQTRTLGKDVVQCRQLLASDPGRFALIRRKAQTVIDTGSRSRFRDLFGGSLTNYFRIRYSARHDKLFAAWPKPISLPGRRSR